MLKFMQVPLPGRKGLLTLLSSIRTLIGTLIRALCEILMAGSLRAPEFRPLAILCTDTTAQDFSVLYGLKRGG